MRHYLIDYVNIKPEAHTHIYTHTEEKLVASKLISIGLFE